MLKSSKQGFSSPWTMNFHMFKLHFEKAEEPEIKLPTSIRSSKKQENSRKTSALLTMPKPLTEWITTNWKILQEMGTPDHLTCLLRNLYAGQEITVRTRYGTMDWFQIGKGVCKGSILSPCLFNSYSEYIMWNNRLDEAQAGIKIVGRNINNLRYTVEKAVAPHSSTLAWKMPWMEEPGGPQSMGSLRVGHDWGTSLSLFTFYFLALEKEMATHSSVLAWRIPGTGEPHGLLSMGSHRVGHD